MEEGHGGRWKEKMKGEDEKRRWKEKEKWRKVMEEGDGEVEDRREGKRGEIKGENSKWKIKRTEQKEAEQKEAEKRREQQGLTTDKIHQYL